MAGKTALKTTKGNQESTGNFMYISEKLSRLHPRHNAEFQVDGISYNSIEQYMLHQKAVTFGAEEIAQDILKCEAIDQVASFDKKIVSDPNKWEAKLEEVIKKGYLAKSLQCKALNQLLYDSHDKNKVFVYVDRKDGVLGTGSDFKDSRAYHRWKGQNMLGKWLMDVRAEVTSQQLTCSEAPAAASQGDKPLAQFISPATGDDDDDEKFTFFWETFSPFSQWHRCTFIVDEITYNCAEQYMMHQKAVTFGDEDTAKKIMASKDQKEQKQLGRQVANFDDKLWDAVSMEIVRKGNLAKFSQNEDLKNSLIKTAGTTLVEASPNDFRWGIGLKADNPLAMSRKNWQGENRLGQVLMEVRDELMRSSSETTHLDSRGANGRDVIIPDGEKAMKRTRSDNEFGHGGKTSFRKNQNEHLQSENLTKKETALTKEQSRKRKTKSNNNQTVTKAGYTKNKNIERKRESMTDTRSQQVVDPVDSLQGQEVRNVDNILHEKVVAGMEALVGSQHEGLEDLAEHQEEEAKKKKVPTATLR